MPDQMNSATLRGPVLATHGMVASEHPLVSQTGIDILRRGGNAFDAALAMSALLPVVKPHRNHLGGDAYILAYPRSEARVTAICSGGKAPAAATFERYANGIPTHGGAAAAIPGLVDAWQEFHDRWCTMSMADLLRPAIGYAREGFAVTRELALSLGAARGLFGKYTTMADALYVDGAPPAFGAIFRQPDLADTLDGIATDGRAAFYEGAIAQRIADAAKAPKVSNEKASGAQTSSAKGSTSAARPVVVASKAAPSITSPAFKAITARTWKLIAKDPGKYAGEAFIVYGAVTQFDAATGAEGFRANIDGVRHVDKWEYSTNTVLSGDSAALADVVEGDLFMAQVLVVGPYSYDTQLGGNTTVPQLSVSSITVLK